MMYGFDGMMYGVDGMMYGFLAVMYGFVPLPECGTCPARAPIFVKTQRTDVRRFGNLWDVLFKAIHPILSKPSGLMYGVLA